MDPTLGMMTTIARGCALLVGRQVTIAELFDFDEVFPGNGVRGDRSR